MKYLKHLTGMNGIQGIKTKTCLQIDQASPMPKLIFFRAIRKLADPFLQLAQVEDTQKQRLLFKQLTTAGDEA